MGKQGKKKGKRKYKPKRHLLQPPRQPETLRDKMAEYKQLAAIAKGNTELIARARAREAERNGTHDTKTDL